MHSLRAAIILGALLSGMLFMLVMERFWAAIWSGYKFGFDISRSWVFLQTDTVLLFYTAAAGLLVLMLLARKSVSSSRLVRLVPVTITLLGLAMLAVAVLIVSGLATLV